MTVKRTCCPAWRLMPAPVPSPQRVRLFKSEHLEKLTLISPRIFALSWGVMLPLIALVGWTYAGSIATWQGLSLIVGGLVAWTLFEYTMHRYLFHWNSDVPVVRWFVFLIHGNHHESPNDPMRGLMPFSVSLPIGALVWAICWMLMGAPSTWLFLGFMTGYVIYDAVHFACHQWPMRGKFGATLKRHHMRHHYFAESGNFAISAIFWDRVFGSRITSLKR